MIKLYQTDTASTPPLEYIQGTAGETFTVGEACVITAGKLKKCGATAKPTYICCGDVTITVAETVPCIRVHGTMKFETTWSADAAAIVVGNKVTLSADAMQVTATTASGVAEVVAFDGTNIDDTVIIRFV